MFSPALRHRQEKLARHAAQAAQGAGKKARKGKAAAKTPEMPEGGAVATEYQNLLIQRDEDLRQLHDIQSFENKATFKATAIEKFLPWLQGALQVEEGADAPQDDIVVTCLIWSLDIRAWELAMKLAAHVIGHDLSLPEQYHRGAAALVVSEIGDAAIQTPGSVPHEYLVTAKAWVEPAFDMKDSYRARLHRALGESYALQAANFDPSADNGVAGGKPALVDAALTELRRAVELDKNVGVKKQIEALEREAKALAAAAGEEG